MSAKGYTTREAAEAVGISRVTLQAWIAGRKLKVPRLRVRAGHTVRLWTKGDLARLRETKKESFRRFGRPRKKRKA